MKTIFIFLLSFTAAISVLAQSVSTVTINVRGNTTQSIVIDNKDFSVQNDYNTNTPIVVSNLQSGQHTLQIKRSDEVNPSSTVFTTRSGYDLQIAITANGSVQLKETKWRADNNSGPYRQAMSVTDFNNLYNTIRSQWGSSKKMTLVSDAFANTNYYFTTAQTRQLIQLVSDDNNRLQLAKDSYDNVVDQSNFNQLYDILSSSSRNEIELYVRNNQNSSTNNNSTVRTPMSTSSYNSI